MDGWYALCLSILKNYNPDTSMAIIETGKLNKNRAGNFGCDSIPEDMIRMREEGLSWTEIGRAYGIRSDNAYRRVQRYIKRKGD